MAELNPGALWALIENYREAEDWRGKRPSGRTLASRVGVSPSAIEHWRFGRKMPMPTNLRALAKVLGVGYRRVLDAALHDAGYLPVAPTVTDDHDGRDKR